MQEYPEIVVWSDADGGRDLVRRPRAVGHFRHVAKLVLALCAGTLIAAGVVGSADSIALNRLLLSAIRERNTSLVHSSLNTGADPNSSSPEPGVGLPRWLAAFLPAHYIHADSRGECALILALTGSDDGALGTDPDSARIAIDLIWHGADVRVFDKMGRQPLEVMDLPVATPDSLAANSSWNPQWIHRRRDSHLELALLCAGADAITKFRNGRCEADTTKSRTVLDMLKRRQVNVFRTPEGEPRLIEAIDAGDRGYFEALLAAGASISDAWMGGKSCLTAAAASDNTYFMRRLLKLGAEVNAFAGNNEGPLRQAVIGGKLGMVELLLGHGANPAVRDARGFTAQMYAACYGDVEKLKLLVRHGGLVSKHDLQQAEIFSSKELGRALSRSVCLLLLGSASKSHRVDSRPG